MSLLVAFNSQPRAFTYLPMTYSTQLNIQEYVHCNKKEGQRGKDVDVSKVSVCLFGIRKKSEGRPASCFG